MAGLGRQFLRFSPLFMKNLSPNRQIATSRTVLGEWNKDWMPGPYPKTAEERAAAAKKYGMLPEDYKPAPDDGTAHGDYPDLPYIGDKQRDLWDDFDDPGLKKNYGEPINLWWDNLRPDIADPAVVLPYPKWQVVASFWAFVFCLCILPLLIAPYASWKQPLMNKDFPYDEGRGKQGVSASGARVIHYSFEPAK